MYIKTCLITLLSALLLPLQTLAEEPTDTASTAMETSVYREDWHIDKSSAQHLRFNVHSTLFFRDNEYSTPMMKGYTLPGFRLRPSVSFNPSERINVEIGLYLFRFWGADSYPNMSYSDIAYWKGSEYATKGFHLLPFFRVQMATEGGLNFVLGSIYGGHHHRLLEPLYAPELNFIADPESGAQILYSNKWLDYDMWINWESFIYKGDTHQEAFTFGVSSRFKYNREEAPVHVYTPVQLLFQHRGGEIDTLHTNSVQTLFNGAVGLATRFDFKHRLFKSLTLQADALVFNQQAGKIWPFDHGWAYFLHGHLDVSHIKAKVGYFHSDKFISLFGYPFFGGVSVCKDGLTFDCNSTLLAGIDYSYDFAPGYTLGGNVVVFRHFASDGLLDGKVERYPSATSFAASLFVRINPSFLIKNFSKIRR